jgi:hypothetical protein
LSDYTLQFIDDRPILEFVDARPVLELSAPGPQGATGSRWYESVSGIPDPNDNPELVSAPVGSWTLTPDGWVWVKIIDTDDSIHWAQRLNIAGAPGLQNVWVQTDAPSSPVENDVWFQV